MQCMTTIHSLTIDGFPFLDDVSEWLTSKDACNLNINLIHEARGNICEKIKRLGCFASFVRCELITPLRS